MARFTLISFELPTTTGRDAARVLPSASLASTRRTIMSCSAVGTVTHHTSPTYSSARLATSLATDSDGRLGLVLNCTIQLVCFLVTSWPLTVVVSSTSPFALHVTE